MINFIFLGFIKIEIKLNIMSLFLKKNISVKIEDFKNVDIICDLNGISNDPNTEINSNHTWNVNYKYRLKFAKLAKLAK